MAGKRERIEREAAVMQKHSPRLPDAVAEKLARVHVRQERDVGAGKEQDKLGPLIEQGRARAYQE